MKKLVIILSSVAGVLLLSVLIRFFALPSDDEGNAAESLEADYSRAVGELMCRQETEVSELNSKVSALESELAALRDELSLLASSNDVTVSEAALTASELEAKKAELQKLGDEYAEAKVKLEEAEKAIKDAAAAQNKAYTALLASFSTKYNASDTARSKNIEVAARCVDGRIIMPDEEFSFLAVVGECTVPKGYVEAKVYYNGETTQGIGGGVCQVSTTLFNAALLANLEITERHNHSMRVSYIAAGQDAAYNYGTMDLKFVNTYKVPVKISAKAVNGVLTFSVYAGFKEASAPQNIEVKVEQTGTNTYITRRFSGDTVNAYFNTEYTK